MANKPKASSNQAKDVETPVVKNKPLSLLEQYGLLQLRRESLFRTGQILEAEMQKIKTQIIEQDEAKKTGSTNRK